MDYINLGIVLDYTLLNSLVKIDNLVEYANNNNIKLLGILNDNSKVVVILDKELRGHKVLVHPNINTATISLEYEDLLKIIKYCNNSYIEI